MKVGIVSDTHNRSAGIDNALGILQQAEVELILHCGDWTTPDTVRYFADQARALDLSVRGVLGNNDHEVKTFLDLAAATPSLELYEGVLRFEMAGRRFIVYHGHHAPTLRKVLVEPCDVLALGHSHKPRYDRLDDKIVINPGSTAFAIPRSKQWQASVVIYDSALHEAEFIYFTPGAPAGKTPLQP